jgi:hypothetical protein
MNGITLCAKGSAIKNRIMAEDRKERRINNL